MLRFEFYVPRSLEDSPEVEAIRTLLEKVKEVLDIKVKEFVIDTQEEKELKTRILWGLSVAKRIRIKQTKKSKLLYPQLIVFEDDTPLTFYPQARSGKEISIKNFLEGLLVGEVRCLHEKFEIEDKLKGR